MGMEIHRFDVHVATDGIDVEKALDTGDYETHRVTILHPDQLLAEQAGPRYGLGTDLAARPMGYTTLWVWAALQRMGVPVTEYPVWKQRVISLDSVKESSSPDDAGEAGGLDPTEPGADTGSP